MENKPYRTLLTASREEWIINKSRFICYGSPAQTEEEAQEFIRRVRSVHPDASHNCYAYAIGANMGIMRYSDDGEPGGTAGMPIMEVIKNRQVTNCAVVITRYFGGVLLGAGGLVRAYSKSASVAIDACGVGTMYPTARYFVEIAYPLLGRAEYILKSQPVNVEDKSFTDRVTLTLTVRERDEESVLKSLTEGLDGKAEALRVETFFAPWREEEN